MATLIARNDAQVVQQVTTLTPVVENSANYAISANGKVSETFVSSGAATAQEIVEGLQALLAAETIAELAEPEYTEDDAIVTATGPTTGKPFVLVDESSVGSAALTVATPTEAKSPNHWIAENFSTGALPANGDTLIVSGLSVTQGFLYDIDQNGVTLAVLDIRHDSQAPIGLTDFDANGYFQRGYRETQLKISASALRIGDGNGNGANWINLNMGANACEATIIKTSSQKALQSYAPVQLVGSHASNSLQLLGGEVDIAMLPDPGAAQWPTIVASGGILRCGATVVLGLVEVTGNALVETRSAVTTLRVRGNGRVTHIGSGNIGTLDHDGGQVTIQATAALTITALTGTGGRTLDLSGCDSNVTVTNGTINATPSNPYTIVDPNNKLVMTNPFSTPNGAQSLVLQTGSGRNVRLT